VVRLPTYAGRSDATASNDENGDGVVDSRDDALVNEQIDERGERKLIRARRDDTSATPVVTTPTATGRVAVDLPRCVRWDYGQPYPKSYLLCGEKLWSWNAGEPAGHVYDLDQAQPGLDLLLLAVKELQERYTAKAQPAGNATRVQLVPKAGGTNELKDAAILVGKDGTLRELTYRDAEGNRTTFRFSDRRALADRSVFTAPGNLKWQREGGATP